MKLRSAFIGGEGSGPGDRTGPVDADVHGAFTPVSWPHMSERHPTSREVAPGSGGRPDADGVPWWVLALALVTSVAVLAAALVVVGPLRSEREQAATGLTTTTVEVTLPEGEDAAPAVDPSGRVAYIDAGGRLLLGEGAETPVVLAEDAAVGTAGLGAVSIAPTGDLLAYVRSDGAVVSLPVPIGGAAPAPPTVLATDASLDAVGGGTTLAWDAAGTSLVYVAVGTEDMAGERPEEPAPLSGIGVYRAPLPDGPLGDVVKVVGRDGSEITRIGDPATRSMVSVAVSLQDDLMVLESVAPGTGQPYTIALSTIITPQELPTPISADEPDFSPDGNFLVVVGPDRSGQELIRVATDSLARAVLVSDAGICNPAVSPDGTRIVYGVGENCDRLELISSLGGTPIDITPPAGPGDRTFAMGELGWTAEGRFVTFAPCRATDGPVECGGPVTFLDPDRRRVIDGPEATTVAPHNRPLLQDLRLDLLMGGPIELESTFELTSELAGEFEDRGDEVGEEANRLAVELVDGERELAIDLQLQDGVRFAVGQMTVVDPDAGIDRTFMVVGTPVVIGVRVVSLSGIWISTDELPATTGEFRLAVRRR